MTQEEKWNELKKVIIRYSDAYKRLENTDPDNYNPITIGALSALDYILEQMNELE